MAGVYSTYSKWINNEIEIAKEVYSKPLVAVEPWASEKTSKIVKDNADEIVKWQWWGRGRRRLHHQRHRHFLWSKSIRILSGDRRSGSARFLFSRINISTIDPVPSGSTG